MLSKTMFRWCGAAATIGGALLMVKSAVAALGGSDLDMLFFSPPFFALGLIGVHGRLYGRGQALGQIGGGLAYCALGTATIAIVAGAFVALKVLGGVDAIPGVVWPIHVGALASAFVLSILGAAVLGLATLRTDSLPVVPIALCMLWIPLLLIGEAIGGVVSPDRQLGLGFLLAGLAWSTLGVTVWSGDTAAQVPDAG